MIYLRQFMVIALISLIGELFSFLIPLPIPASIYGIVILLALLISGRLKADSIRGAATFLIQIMQVTFIPAGVGLMESFGLLRSSLAAYLTILVVSTYAVMIVSGLVTQHVIRKTQKKEENGHA